ncbi:phospholipid carrier-dependent glycosyltransferase [Erythrobacter sp. A6_0]|uniref:phospholipid carrier-dependent glycosyltransferase n=1 Tax=Erythrobacter sp. A6_0 TaxID=2821089 RepID=UPI001ADC12F8|nr:phospholipid carrier-dependent glycosyltransferase [Erythrobacter sp. A6_0]MBO9510223.1 phospholipid carrier-dependent glycosyltransferase [Erythrobacter sp. A6_0]
MKSARTASQDPIGWCALLAIAFLALCCVRLTIPGIAYFDEVHYVPALREWLSLGEFTNREHPPFAKQLLALSVLVFGDTPLGWRALPVVAGAAALFASMRALWFATLSRFATLAYGVLLATGFLLFVNARIAMLDIFYLAFLALAFWQSVAAMREPETGRRRLAIAGVMLGLAMASKWNALVLAPVPGLVFLALRWAAGRRRLFLSRRGLPVPGITLVEAAFWLGLLPLMVYAATYLPAYLFSEGAIGSAGAPANILDLHRTMLTMQENVVKPHPYQSVWWQWVLNWRAIWYLYEPVDGAYRGILLIGNPLTMLLGLPALVWCLWRGLAKRDPAALSVALLYLLTLGFWIVAAKPIQFYYHYLLPSMFLLAALALALDALWQSGRRWLALGPLAISAALFAWFYPILSAAPLDGKMAFLEYTWLKSWQ